ncbi:MAG: hypothetical protein AABY79_10100 [Nitrospirota bacterium]|jgi:hypothetical protein
MKKGILFLAAGVLAITFLSACAAGLQNYDKVALGMSKEDVTKIAGKPSKVLEGETTGEGGLINKAGKYEIWIYRGSALVFSEDKLVNKVRKGRH